MIFVGVRECYLGDFYIFKGLSDRLIGQTGTCIDHKPVYNKEINGFDTSAKIFDPSLIHTYLTYLLMS
jgi:hypothetical protein